MSRFVHGPRGFKQTIGTWRRRATLLEIVQRHSDSHRAIGWKAEGRSKPTKCAFDLDLRFHDRHGGKLPRQVLDRRQIALQLVSQRGRELIQGAPVGLLVSRREYLCRPKAVTVHECLAGLGILDAIRMPTQPLGDQPTEALRPSGRRLRHLWGELGKVSMPSQ